jgi:ribosomal protein uL24|tara:strand:+ start:471 stop:974 length:504 start_codon:yes stop_codon:yes gene_type:complete
VKQKFVAVHLDKKLREKANKRALPVRKGDEVKVMRGKRKGSQAKVAAVSILKNIVYLEGQTRDNARGTKTLIPFKPSNLLLITMVDDKRRNRQGKKVVKKKVEVKKPVAEKKKTEKPKPVAPKKEEPKPVAPKKEAPKKDNVQASKSKTGQVLKPEKSVKLQEEKKK